MVQVLSTNALAPRRSRADCIASQGILAMPSNAPVGLNLKGSSLVSSAAADAAKQVQSESRRPPTPPLPHLSQLSSCNLSSSQKQQSCR